MKNIKHIVATVLMLLAITTKAQTTETEITDERIEDLSKKMCIAALTFRASSADKAGSNIEGLILNFLRTSKEDPNYKEKLTKFWDENNEKCICHDEGSTERTRNPQHFLKRIVDLGMYNSVFYHWLLSDPEEYPVDVNAVEIYNGKEETLLDYIDYILNKPNANSEYNLKEIQSLRDWLVMGYNAKTAAELKK